MKKQIAEELLDIRAVFLQPNDPFTWSSGIKSPIYCDNRLTLSYPKTRQKIAAGLAELIQKEYPEAEIIAGTATAGIPHAAWVSDVLNLPMCYVRSKAKEHGKGNQIEGKAEPGSKVVVIEDLISTGGSAITAAEALRAAGCDVLGVAAIFTYGLPKGEARLAEAELKAVALSDYDALIEVAAQKNYVKTEDIETLKKWKQAPDAWGTN
ncbi:orotate phosphoribosyltransferase [Domibacillus robiginosus]|uniref:orotate phosphoribosyltransferase n=1 Tax=Domibacillus robiginosus TaxID=1071054 RepID=UPI00067B7E2D|nr:orotate phosphoribosyltransferase [Domibacillus robiginosus]